MILCDLGNVHRDLVPPSHFASSAQFAGPHRVVQNSGTMPPVSWTNTGMASTPSGDPSPPDPWLAISQAQQEILELRKENQRIMMLQKDSIRGRIPREPLSDPRARYPNNVFCMGRNTIISCQLGGILRTQVCLSETQMWRGKWAVVQMGVGVASRGREAQGRSWEVEEAGGGLEEHCRETHWRN